VISQVDNGGRRYPFRVGAWKDDDYLELVRSRGCDFEPQNRPSIPMSEELVGGKDFTSFRPADEQHRVARIMYQMSIGTAALLEPSWELIQCETRKSILKITASPERIPEHVRQ
jgi:hypothetical protein